MNSKRGFLGLGAALILALLFGGVYSFASLSSTAAVAPANDSFPGTEVTSLPFSDTQDTTEATLEEGEPTPCPIEATVWYNYTSDADATLIADTAGSDFEAMVSVYTGTSLTDLTLVTCNVASVSLAATAGQTYFFQVGGLELPPPPPIPPGPAEGGQPQGAGGGNLVFNLDVFEIPPCAPPAFTVPDPQGDTHGFGATQHDIISVSGGADAENFCLTVEFAEPVDPADAGTGQEVVGFIDFDTDQNPRTGFPSSVNFFCPAPTTLGVERTAFLFDVSGPTLPIDGELAAIVFDETSFSAIIPLTILTDSFNFAMVLGTFAEPTDCAPNGGFLQFPPAPNMRVKKTASPALAAAGVSLTYTLEVTNVGNLEALDVVLTDDLPPEVTFVAVTPGAPTCSHDGAPTGGTITCNLGTLGIGQSATVTIEVTAPEVEATTAITNQAAVSASNEPPPNIGPENSASVSTDVYPLGDVNCSDDITIVDAITIAQRVVGLLGPFACPGGDTNGDGHLTIVDALLVAQLVVGLIPEFP